MRSGFYNKHIVDLRPRKQTLFQAMKERASRAIKTLGNIFFSRGCVLVLGFIFAVLFAYCLFNRETLIAQWTALDQTVYHTPDKPNAQGLNLVFLADDYPSWEEFNNDVDQIMMGVRTVEPWKSYDRFNIYKINPKNGASLCQVKTENERKPVLRCNERINGYFEALKLPRAKFIVFSRKDFQSWANVTRLENAGIFFSVPLKIEPATALAQSYLMLHLLGHAFGLKDEEKFVIAKAQGAPHLPDGPNCAPDKATAEKWWGDLAEQYPDRVGYFNTCAGSDEYIRPTKSSLLNFGDMTDFIADYGPVSERYLSKILKYCFSNEYHGAGEDRQFFEMYPEFKACVK